nr:hypothetical protein [Pseudoxanthomonas sp.]
MDIDFSLQCVGRGERPGVGKVSSAGEPGIDPHQVATVPPDIRSRPRPTFPPSFQRKLESIEVPDRRERGPNVNLGPGLRRDDGLESPFPTPPFPPSFQRKLESIQLPDHRERGPNVNLGPGLRRDDGLESHFPMPSFPSSFQRKLESIGIPGCRERWPNVNPGPSVRRDDGAGTSSA